MTKADCACAPLELCAFCMDTEGLIALVEEIFQPGSAAKARRIASEWKKAERSEKQHERYARLHPNAKPYSPRGSYAPRQGPLSAS